MPSSVFMPSPHFAWNGAWHGAIIDTSIIMLLLTLRYARFDTERSRMFVFPAHSHSTLCSLAFLFIRWRLNCLISKIMFDSHAWAGLRLTTEHKTKRSISRAYGGCSWWRAAREQGMVKASQPRDLYDGKTLYFNVQFQNSYLWISLWNWKWCIDHHPPSASSNERLLWEIRDW